MKKLKLLILIFVLAISIPLVYLGMQTFRSMEQEELAELRYFAETLFDEMEEELGSVVAREEGRAIDAYNYNDQTQNRPSVLSGKGRSASSRFPQESYILGYLQNNPDGSFQTPVVKTIGNSPADQAELVLRLKKVNDAFNSIKSTVPDSSEIKPPQILVQKERIKTLRLAQKYLKLSRFSKQKIRLKHNKRRIEYVPTNQVLNIAKPEEWKAIIRIIQAQKGKQDKNSLNNLINKKLSKLTTNEDYSYARILQQSDTVHNVLPGLFQDSGRMQVEVDPMQSAIIDNTCVYLFRRILLNNQVYHQGVVVKIKELLEYIIENYFAVQPISNFTNLRLKVTDQQREITAVQAGAAAVQPRFSLSRNFSRPFSFLNAKITCDDPPRSSGRRTLNIMMVVLVSVILMGLFAIYKSAGVVLDMSERRSSFVSSVTHELKTPLSAIRMYIEMLEQGVARNPEREQEYFRILGSESARLSRLINNVLEFSKLEKKQRHLELKVGTFEEVIQEFTDVMQQKLRQEGFTLKIERDEIRPFKYDREVMVQVLINLGENSMKFGRNSTKREITLQVGQEGKRVKIMVSDTGPGIPRHALKKVFDNFYRVDDELTRTTRGTGIGLALVKSFITAMGGTVSASNNDGPGCTITISLPANFLK